MSQFRCLSFVIRIFIAASIFFATTTNVSAQEGDCVGGFYRAKVEDVPVYDEPSTTGEVLTKLPLGTRVCYLGEKSGFAILEWPLRGPDGVQSTLLPKESTKTPNDETRKIAYARTVDLWPPTTQSPREGGILNSIKRYLYGLQHGIVPDDGLAPYRPVIRSLGAPTDPPLEKQQDSRAVEDH